jgi:hypothetical protein
LLLLGLHAIGDGLLLVGRPDHDRVKGNLVVGLRDLVTLVMVHLLLLLLLLMLIHSVAKLIAENLVLKLTAIFISIQN